VWKEQSSNTKLVTQSGVEKEAQTEHKVGTLYTSKQKALDHSDPQRWPSLMNNDNGTADVWRRFVVAKRAKHEQGRVLQVGQFIGHGVRCARVRKLTRSLVYSVADL
jgi:hypothetical protein